MSSNSSSGYFLDYQENTLDPGWSFILGSLIACVLLHATLPCLVSLGSRYEKCRIETVSNASLASTEDEKDNASDESSPKWQVDIGRLQPINESTVSRTPNEHRSTNQRTVGPQGWLADESTQMFGFFCGMAADSIGSYGKKENSRAPSAVSRATTNSDAASSVFACRPRRYPTFTMTRSVSSQQSSRIGFKNTGIDRDHQHARKKSKPISMSRTSSYSQEGSAMSRLHPDDVSFREAVDCYSSDCYQLPKEHISREVDILFGEHAWWRPKMIVGAFDRIVGIADWDSQMSALVKIALPISVQSFSNGFFNLLDVALVGHLIGAPEANAFVVVCLLTWITSTLNYGFCEALGKTIPGALDSEDNILVGMYFNISISLFTLAILPMTGLWCIGTKETFLWLGFDNSSAEMAQNFAYFQVVLEWVAGIEYCFRLFLDVTGHERFSNFSMILHNIGQTFGILIPALIGKGDLIWVGAFRAVIACCLLAVNGCAVMYLGYADPYAKGFFTMPFRDSQATGTILRMAGPLGIAYILTYGEWEILVFFAAALGPAEVATWALLGYVWSILKYISDGIADAAEVCCALYLVSNKADLARLSAYKSLYLGLVLSLVMTSILFMAAEPIVLMLTPDATLQRLAIELFPLIGIGHVVMTTGIVSWALVGSQGRYRRATSVQFLFSWGATLPLSALFTYCFRIDLQGLTSAFVLGSALAGAGNTFILIRSQWQRLATTMYEENSIEDERLLKADTSSAPSERSRSSKNKKHPGSRAAAS